MSRPFPVRYASASCGMLQMSLPLAGFAGSPAVNSARAFSPRSRRSHRCQRRTGARLCPSIDGSGLHPVVEGEYPIWSSDGSWIAFRSDRGGSWAIRVMRADGTDLRKVVDASALPVWFREKITWRPQRDFLAPVVRGRPAR